jgi:hypothetical protein
VVAVVQDSDWDGPGQSILLKGVFYLIGLVTDDHLVADHRGWKRDAFVVLFDFFDGSIPVITFQVVNIDDLNIDVVTAPTVA